MPARVVGASSVGVKRPHTLLAGPQFVFVCTGATTERPRISSPHVASAEFLTAYQAFIIDLAWFYDEPMRIRSTISQGVVALPCPRASRIG